MAVRDWVGPYGESREPYGTRVRCESRPDTQRRKTEVGRGRPCRLRSERTGLTVILPAMFHVRQSGKVLVQTRDIIQQDAIGLEEGSFQEIVPAMFLTSPNLIWPNLTLFTNEVFSPNTSVVAIMMGRLL